MAGERNGPGGGSVGVVVRPSFGGSLVSEGHKPCTPELLSGSRPIQQRLVCVEAGQTFSIQRVKVPMPQISSVHCRLTHGYSVTPHLAARMFRDTAHLVDTVSRLTDHTIQSIFVIAGDSTEPAGPFADSLALLEQLATWGHPFHSIGVGGYPEGHAHISDDQVARALAKKTRHATHIVTQMCFRGSTTAMWAREVKRRGVDLPIRIGLPGAVTRQKLARISGSIGLGQSSRFLAKQNSVLWRFFLPGGYRPDRLIKALVPTLGGADHTLAGFHFFTFNEVSRTEAWRQAWLTRLHQAAHYG
jgi:methylenetetrahydrofolate reductase (NADPH)